MMFSRYNAPEKQTRYLKNIPETGELRTQDTLLPALHEKKKRSHLKGCTAENINGFLCALTEILQTILN